MRIALLHQHGDPGGAEYPVRTLRNLLIERGHRAIVIDPVAQVRTGRGFSRASRLAPMLDQIQAFAPDPVHLHNLDLVDGGIVAALAGRGWPIVRTLHDHSIVCPAGSLFARGQPCERCLGGRFYRAGLNGCIGVPVAFGLALSSLARRHDPMPGIARFLAPSEALKQALVRAGVRKRVDTVGHFLAADRFVNGQATRERTVVFAGRLVSGKGLETLIDAVSGLDARVVVLGRGPLGDALAERVRRERLSNVVMRGRLEGEEYVRELSTAAVVVVPSVAAEAFGLTACEALAAGVPIVATTVGGLPDLVGDNERGLLVPPGNGAALRQAIELFGDDERRRRMAAAARQHARDHLPPTATTRVSCPCTARWPPGAYPTDARHAPGIAGCAGSGRRILFAGSLVGWPRGPRGDHIFAGRAFPPPRGLNTVPRYGEASPKCTEGGKARRDGALPQAQGVVSPPNHGA
jgi:glycosyltransferase involved in cell wall biosynthesis